MPVLANSASWSSAVTVALPNCTLQYPSGVYSDINLFSVSIYLPTLIPGLSDALLGSSTKIVFSANASTSYHLSGEVINSSYVGGLEYDVPSFCINEVILITFFSGKKNS